MADAPEQSNHIRTILLKLEQYHSEGKYWDVQLRIDTKVFNTQRSLLAVNSEYFDAMFTSNFVESNKTTDEPITLTEMDASAFGELLHFMYTGHISVKDSNVLPLLFMNDFFRLRSCHVREQCLEHLKMRSQENEPMENALDLLCFTYLKGEEVFVEILNAHICGHLYHYSKDARLMEISYEILNALLEFSKDYILSLRGSAVVLLKIVHNWINHNREGRSQYDSNLKKNINFANVSTNCSRSLINKLDKAVNEVVKHSKNIESLSELRMLVKEIDTNLTYVDAQLDAIISFSFEKVSEMRTDMPIVYSSSCIVSDFSWKIGIGCGNDEFRMSLYCDGPSLMSEWNCYASAIFTIVSHKKGRDDFVRNTRLALFTSNKKFIVWSPLPHMKWSDLMDSANGYRNDDDSITINVHVYADVPFRKMM